MNDVPNDGKKVATIHTHPNSTSFSDSDLKNAKKRKMNSYVIGPDLFLRKYNYSTEEKTKIIKISPKKLSNEQKKELKKLKPV